MENQFLNTLINETIEEEEFKKQLINKAFGVPKMPGGGGKAGKITVYWQGQGNKRPLTINASTPMPQGYGPNPKQKTGEEGPKSKQKKQEQSKDKQDKQSQGISEHEKEQLTPVLQKLKDTINQKLGGKTEPQAEKIFREKRAGESELSYRTELLTNSMNYVSDLAERLGKVKTTDLETESKKQKLIDETIKNMHKRLEEKIKFESQNVADKTKGKKEDYQYMVDKMNEYEQRGLKSVSGAERDEYFKFEKEVKKTESKEALLTQSKSSIEDQKKRAQKSQEYVHSFEQQVKPANKITIPEIKPLIKNVEKAENNGLVDKNAPKKDTMLKMSAARFLNRALKVLKMDNAQVASISAKGSAMSLAIKAPMQIGEAQIKQLNKLIQRQYGLTTPAQVNYKAGGVVEFEFSKQKKEDIIRPTFSGAVNDLSNYINSKKTSKGLRRLAMILGYDSKGQPIIGDFTDYFVTSIGTISSPGKGKTFNTDSTLLSMIANYSPDELKIDLIDAQGVGFSSIRKNSKNYLDNEPGMGVKTKQDVQRVMNIVESNLQTIADRGAILSKYGVEKWTDLPDKTGNRQFPLKMIVIDEFQGLYTGIDAVYGEGSPEASELKTKLTNTLSDIQKQGRKVGVIPWVMTQTVDDENEAYFKAASTKVLYQVNDPKTGQDFLGVKGRDVARNLIDVGQSAIQTGAGGRRYGVGVMRNGEVSNTVTQEAGTRK